MNKPHKNRVKPKVVVVLGNPRGNQLSLSQAKADPSIIWARLNLVICVNLESTQSFNNPLPYILKLPLDPRLGFGASGI